MKRLLVLLAALAMTLSMALPAGAITDGELDGDGHPDVVLILMEENYEPAYRCSGTLIAPTYVLTAGHCAGAPGEFTGMRVFTESDVDGGNNNYPYGDNDDESIISVEAVRWAAHPLYPTAPFWFHDVGMIELAEPIALDEYGTLPEVDQLDAFRSGRGHRGQTFTAVGYGVQQAFPDAASWKEQADRVRYVAYPELIQINTPGFTGDFSMLLSNNPTTGGTCFGDSGGPNFLGDTNVVAGVTSFGMNGTCAGTGGVFRVDRQNVLDFINDFMNP